MASPTLGPVSVGGTGTSEMVPSVRETMKKETTVPSLSRPENRHTSPLCPRGISSRVRPCWAR